MTNLIEIRNSMFKGIPCIDPIMYNIFNFEFIECRTDINFKQNLPYYFCGVVVFRISENINLALSI